MIKDLNGFWKGIIIILVNVIKLDFDFIDGNNWDNNSNKDWYLLVWLNFVLV